ncbi:hypothetical protein HMPREF0072_0647 [Anaerococcus lactolyticus ATCC 51172]|uniref:Uncharacterized protein n=1 Tax=Anaerococcus lactolyticus ATCC 51172 TaxID=525254 RepID=C2BE77_9FIRM|nr:hypothetical protein [Anaerococcus lactolyticus]EEI86719.1 hypothetical protein HMPREF0072_0647 [Anaerococcus lactolyticus ATCC 51172]
MNKFKDFLGVSKIAFKETIKKINKSYMVFIFVLINTIFENNEFNLGVIAGTIGGIINYFIGVIISCFVVQSLVSVVKFGNTGKSSLENSVGNFFGPMIETMFWVYLLEMFTNLLLVNFPVQARIFVVVLIQILLSSIYEQIYLNGRSGVNAIIESVNFVKNNPLHYGLYSLIFIGVEFYLSLKFAIGQPMGREKIIACLIIALVHTGFMLFRGILFKHLNKHSYRQRKFMGWC